MTLYDLWILYLHVFFVVSIVKGIIKEIKR
jgi:hypothetical protein